MFANGNYAVNGQFVATQTQSLGDALVHGYIVFFGYL